MIQKSLDFGDEVFIQNMSIPVWRADIEYQEGAIVEKGGVLAKYWRDRKSGKLIWLSVKNAEQYDMFVNQIYLHGEVVHKSVKCLQYVKSFRFSKKV